MTSGHPWNKFATNYDCDLRQRHCLWRSCYIVVQTVGVPFVLNTKPVVYGPCISSGYSEDWYLNIYNTSHTCFAQVLFVCQVANNDLGPSCGLYTFGAHVTFICALADPGGLQGQMFLPQESGEGIQCKYAPRKFFTDALKSTYKLEKKWNCIFIYGNQIAGCIDDIGYF